MIGYAIQYVGTAVLGLGFLFTVGASITWWQDRRRRAHYRYWNTRT
jgi:hypothetical protein